MLYITGLTGHSGYWLYQRLIQENYDKKIKYITKNDKATFIDHSKLNIIKDIGDLGDLEFLTKSMKGAEVVLHISSILLSENVLKAALFNNVKWVIMVHTTGRFSSFKSASEEYIKIEDGILEQRKDINITIVRPTMIYGSSRDQNMYKLVDYLNRHKFFPLFGEGNNVMQPVHARDLGNAYYDILMNPEVTMNKEYDLSGKEPIKYKDLIQTVSKELNRKNILIKLPIGFSIFSTKIYNKISKNALINVEQVLRMQEDKAFSHELAKKDFRYNPCSFAEGIVDEVKDYLQKSKN